MFSLTSFLSSFCPHNANSARISQKIPRLLTGGKNLLINVYYEVAALTGHIFRMKRLAAHC